MTMYDKRMATLLTKVTGTAVSEKDFIAWAGDENGAQGSGWTKVDRIVKKFLGKELYEEAEVSARMLGVLEARLKGQKTATLGGMKFKFK